MAKQPAKEDIDSAPKENDDDATEKPESKKEKKADKEAHKNKAANPTAAGVKAE